MKKTWHILLFVSLLLCLLGATLLATSAANEWRLYDSQSEADADTGNTAGTPYSSLKTAVDNVTADGQVIKLTTDVTVNTQVAFNNTHTYTIDGKNLTYTCTPTASNIWNFSAGNVTIKNITLASTVTTYDLIATSGKTLDLTLSGVTVTGGKRQIMAAALHSLTIVGGDYGTGIAASNGYIMHLSNASGDARSDGVGCVTIEGGTFHGGIGTSNPLIVAAGAKLIVNGGLFDHNYDAIIRIKDYDVMSPVIINGGTFTATGNCAVVEAWYSYNGGNNNLGYIHPNQKTDDEFAIISVNGGTFHINSRTARAILCLWNVARIHPSSEAAYTPKIYVRGGTFDTDQDALTNGFIQDNLDNTNNKPAHVQVEYYITGGTFTGCSYWLQSNGYSKFYIGDPSTHEGPTFSGGASDVTLSGCISVGNNTCKGSELNIYGGTFTCSATGKCPVICCSGAKLTITGGTFAVTDPDNYALLFTSGVGAAVTGGSFSGKVLGYDQALSPLTITGGSFTNDVSRYVPGHNGAAATESAGVFTVHPESIPVFCGTQLALGKSLTLYVYTVVPTAEVPANQAAAMTLKATMHGNYFHLTNPAVLTEYPDGSPVDSGYTLLRFTFAGIAPQYMNDNLTLVLRRSNDAEYATLGSSYCIKNYCQSLLSDPASSAEVKTLVSDLLNYGAAAQTYIGYHTDALVTSGVSGMTAGTFSAVSGSPAASFVGTGSNGYKLTECGLRFDSLNRLFVRFTAPDPEGIVISYTVGGENRGRAVIRTDGPNYIAYTEGLTTADFEKVVVFTMTDNKDDGVNVVTQSCSYSVSRFIENNQNNDGAPNVKALARALSCYQQSAAAFLTEPDFVPALRFVAISDIHFMTDNDTSSRTTVMPTQTADLIRCNTRLASLFTRAYEYAAGQTYDTVDAFMLVGDNTDDGTVKQIEDFFSIVHDNIDSAQSKLLIVNGNHEFYDTGESGGGSNNHGTTDSRLTSKAAASGITNCSALKFHTTVNGYHFIGFSPTNNGGRAFSDEIAEWLDEEIATAVAEDPTKPVFVCQHQQVHSTVYGCPGATATYSQNNIREVLAKYPQVVDFAGHSHSVIDHPNSVWQGEFTALSTGTLAYTESPTNTRGGTHATGHSDPYNEYNEKETAEFTIVELDANNRLRLIYIHLDENDDTTPVLMGERIINVVDPAKFNWNDEMFATFGKPAFIEGQELTRNEIDTPTTLQINIPQATCEAGVKTYRCELYSESGALLKTVTRVSGQYRRPVPDCTVPFTNLTPNTTYTVKVYPVSNLGACGEPIEGTFTTDAQPNVYEPDIFSAQFNSDGTVTNAVNGDALVKNGTATATDGKAAFSGAGDFQWRGIEPYYELFQTSFTFETYAKVTSASRGKFIAANFAYHIPSESPSTTQVHGGFGFKVESDGKLSFYLLTSNTAVGWHNISNATLLTHAVTTSTAYDNNTYVHLVGTYDGSTIKFYVNGELVGSISRAGVLDYPLKTTGQYLSIGGDSDLDYVSKDFVTGEISKVNIYSTAMTAEQVSTLYGNRES